MSFQLSKTIDREKIFFVKSNKLEGRIDPHFYKPEYQRNVEKIKNKKSLKLNAIVQFSSETWDQKSYFGDTFPYVEIGEIDLLTGEIKNIQEVPVKDAASRARMIVRNKDIIISTTRPQRGAISLINNPKGLLIASTGFAVVRGLRSYEIHREFLFHLLRLSFSLKQFEQRSSGGNYPAITTEELKKILLPIPSTSVQNNVVEKIHNAYELKKQKEAKAQELFSKIDKCFLSKIDIKIEEFKGEEKRIFSKDHREISGFRIDPKYHLKIGILLGLKPKYCFTKLKDVLAVAPQYGANESAIDGNPYQDVRYIRITDINDYGELKEDDWKTASKIDLKYMLKNDDFLFARSGSVGRAFLYKDIYGKAIFAGYLIRFMLDSNKILPEYLLYFTFTSLYKYWIDAIHRPAVQSNINSEEYKNLLIPLPPKAIQYDIVIEIHEMLEKAKKLRQEAIAEVERAKAEVEKMILGV